MASRLLTRSAISPRPRTTVRFSSGAKAAMMHLPTVRRRNPKSVVSDVQADNVILNGQPYNLIRYWNRRCTVQTRESSVKSTEAPEDLHKLFATALNSGDLDALVALYAFDG